MSYQPKIELIIDEIGINQLSIYQNADRELSYKRNKDNPEIFNESANYKTWGNPRGEYYLSEIITSALSKALDPIDQIEFSINNEKISKNEFGKKVAHIELKNLLNDNQPFVGNDNFYFKTTGYHLEALKEFNINDLVKLADINLTQSEKDRFIVGYEENKNKCLEADNDFKKCIAGADRIFSALAGKLGQEYKSSQLNKQGYTYYDKELDSRQKYVSELKNVINQQPDSEQHNLNIRNAKLPGKENHYDSN